MTFKRSSHLFFLISLLLLATLACQLSSADAPVPIDREEIVRDAVATITAQQPPQPAAVPTITTTNLPAASVDLQNTLINVYQQRNPSVVQIFVSESFQGTEIGLGTGSGFVYDTNGHIITNNHVVVDGENFEVSFASGDRRLATVVGMDVDSDLAVIKVDSLPEGIQPIPLGNSNVLQVGQFVVAIGNPFGEAGSMSVGIISGLGRTVESQRIAEGGGRYSLPQVIQTDAAINPGNSGGPLLNLQGEVIGVNSSILTTTGANSGVGFSIPVAAVQRIVPVLIEKGVYEYPYMGIRMTNLTLDTYQALGLSQLDGAYILEVSPGSPSDEAGLIASGLAEDNDALSGGDLITAVDGQPVKTVDDLISYLVFNTTVGQTIQLTVLRNGGEVTLPLVLGARP